MYARAEKHFQKKHYIAASDDFQALEAHYPFGEYAEVSQLANIYALFKSDKPVEAIAAAERFIQLYPRHAHVDYAYFMKGLIHYHSSLGTFQKYLPINHAERDIHPLLAAFDGFKAFVQLFPDSQYVPGAIKRMQHIKNQLARHELAVARYYFSRKAYIAATNRLKVIITRYDGADCMKEALMLQVKAYEGLGLSDLAEDTRAVLALNFPG